MKHVIFFHPFLNGQIKRRSTSNNEIGIKEVETTFTTFK